MKSILKVKIFEQRHIEETSHFNNYLNEWLKEGRETHKIKIFRILQSVRKQALVVTIFYEKPVSE